MLAEADAGRGVVWCGVVLLDCQGDLARNVLDRLPAQCADRLVILDPAETEAPPAWNVLAPLGGRGDLAGREWAAENVVGVFRRLYAAWWGPRMDDTLLAACLTLARRPGSTLADVVPLLTDPVNGGLLDYGRTTYRPPANLNDHVRARDVTCRFPGCQQPSDRTDLDHTQPYPAGPTSAANLGALCKPHHRLKHETGWTLEQDQGTFTWTSPTGRTYTREPEPIGDLPDDPPPF